jgi:uncharacterized protein YjbI with pentapeptide repeats
LNRPACAGAVLVRGLAWLLAVLGAATAAAEAPPLAPEAALAAIAERGSLRGAAIAGDLDLSRLAMPPGATAVELIGVEVDGRVHASDGRLALPFRCIDCTLAAIDLRGARVAQAFEIEGGRILRELLLEEARFAGPVRFAGVSVPGKAVFRGVTFEQAAGFLDVAFEEPAGRSGVRFSEATFRGPARFDGTHVASNLRFDSAVFADDASFLKLAVDGIASFRNAQFRKDAEFRFCRLGNADFGNEEMMTAFLGLADFRGCRFGAGRFDFAEFRGDALFVDVEVAGDLSLRSASFRGPGTDFSGLAVGGRLDLARAHAPNLRLRWGDVGPAIRRAEPDSAVLLLLQKRLEFLGEDADAREVAYLVSERRMHERVARPDTPWTEKAWLRAEWLLWGLPTGYGTKLGRIGAIALFVWLLAALSLLRPRGLIANWPQGAAPELGQPPYQPLALEQLPAGACCDWRPAARLSRALRYAFTLLFKVPLPRSRIVDPPAGGRGAYLQALWWLGSVLLALLAVTLAKVSPVVQAIIGRVAG